MRRSDSRNFDRANTRHVGENGVKVVVEKNERYALWQMQITDVELPIDDEFVVHDIKVNEKGNAE